MRRVLQIVLPVVFIALGVAAFAVMRASVGTAEKAPAPVPAAAVDVVVATAATHHAVIEATGTMEASSRVELVAQVAGRVVAIADGLTPGRRFRRGELIARVDPRDYEAQVTQAEAAVQARQVELELELSRSRQAAREAELLGTTPDSPLTRREPQLALARANLQSAEATLATARLNLERTRLVAPFDAIVASESLEIGTYVAPGAPVASLAGTDRYRVRVSVPVRRLGWIDAPTDVGDRGSDAIVTQALGSGRRLTREGYVMRQLGELDPESRTAAVLVAIDDPLDGPAGSLPILPGAYVDIAIQGREVQGVFELPRPALVEGSHVFVATPEDTLARREVSVAWGTRDRVYVDEGLAEGDRVLVTPLSLPIEGMPLDVRTTVAEAR